MQRDSGDVGASVGPGTPDVGRSACDGFVDARPSRRRLAFVVTLVVVVFFAVTSSPYVQYRPGTLVAIMVPGSQFFMGEYSYPTVEVSRLRWWQFGWFGEDDVTRAAYTNSAVDSEMERAKTIAWDLASTATGVYDCDPPRIKEFMPDAPAAEAGIRLEDEIVAVNGVDLHCTAELVAVIRLSGGSPLGLSVRRDGEVFDVVVRPEFIEDRWRIGVSSWVGTAPGLPVNTQGVGGSSAGLMLMLAYVDSLQPGDLSSGLHVSGTGSITFGGVVGPVGGVDLKAEIAAAAGVDVFFVPVSQVEQAQAVAGPGMAVVPVGSVWDALSWLCGQGAPQDVCSHW